MWPAFVWTSTKNERDAQNTIWSRAFRPSTPRNLIARVLTICHVKHTQSIAMEQKRSDFQSLSPALPNLWLLLVFSHNFKYSKALQVETKTHSKQEQFSE